MKTVTFFNNKGGVGKTSLLYHLAWMLRELGYRVITVDLDPQSNLTSAFLEDDTLEQLWPDGNHPKTILGALQLLIEHMGDIAPVEPYPVADGLWLVPGDLGLSNFEDRLSQAWRDCLSDNSSDAGDAFRVMTSFYRVAVEAGRQRNVDIALLDVGPNIGAMNRAALVASDYVVIPLGADLFSLQGLRNLGPTLRSWRNGWRERRARVTVPPGLEMPCGAMAPLGYVVLNPSVRSNRPVKAYKQWADRIPGMYTKDVLGESGLIADENQLAMVKHFKSLMPLAQDARKPMFLLKPADGAIGGHTSAVTDCYSQFHDLALRIARGMGLQIG
ncbi:MAG: ParA family protein [Planctomycetes bacterium]|nr:ParA family protein [Planctomycetota bacterium]